MTRGSASQGDDRPQSIWRLGFDHTHDDRAQRLECLRIDHARGLQLGEGAVAVLAGLVAGIVAAAEPFDGWSAPELNLLCLRFEEAEANAPTKPHTAAQTARKMYPAAYVRQVVLVSEHGICNGGYGKLAWSSVRLASEPVEPT
jgi:hypothetical protein